MHNGRPEHGSQPPAPPEPSARNGPGGAPGVVPVRATGPAAGAAACHSPAGTSRSETELMQYRWSVGVG